MADIAVDPKRTGLPGDAVGPLRHSVARAAMASGVAETVSRVLTIVLSIATARILIPSQVGVLGLAVIVVGIISLIAACSETAGVVGRHKATDSQHALAATAVRGLIVAVLVAGSYLALPAIARLLASAEDAEPQLITLVRLLLWVPVMELAGCYPRVLLQRRLDLTYIATVGLLHVAFQVGLALLMLWLGYGALGVAWSTVIGAGLCMLAMWFRVLASGQFKWKAFQGIGLLRAMVHDTSKVLAGGFIGYLNGRIDNLLVAGALGPAAMSFYGMAWSASRIAPQILGQSLGFVLVPTLAQIKDDRQRMVRALNVSVRHAYLILAPLAAGLFVSAPSLVTTVLGPKWSPVTPCLQVMSLTIMAGPLTAAANAVLIATGRAHVAGLASAGQMIVLATLILPLSRTWGVVGAAYGDLVAVSVLAIAFLALSPLLRITLRQGLLASISISVIAAAATGLIAWAASAQLASPGLKLLVQSGVLLIGYPAILSVLGGKAALRDLFGLLKTTSRRVGPAPSVSPLST